MGDVMGSLSPFHWLFLGVFALIIPIVLFAYPIARILQRLGISPWWTIMAFFPMLNLIGVWTLAFAPWPKVDGPQS
jgi:hypothetical protein